MKKGLLIIFAIFFLASCGGGAGNDASPESKESPAPLFSIEEGVRLDTKFIGPFVLKTIRTVTLEDEVVLDVTDIDPATSISINVKDEGGVQYFDAVSLLFGFGPLNVSGNISLVSDPSTLVIEITSSNIGPLPVGEIYNMVFVDSENGFNVAIEASINGKKVLQFYDFEHVE